MILPIIQIILSAVIIFLILLQERSGGLSSFLGAGGESGGLYHARRGLEKIVFVLTIVLTLAFITITILQLISSR